MGNRRLSDYSFNLTVLVGVRPSLDVHFKSLEGFYINHFVVFPH